MTQTPTPPTSDAMEKIALESSQALRSVNNLLVSLRDLVLQDQTDARMREHPNPLNHFGAKCFSQADEDGITLEIVRRLGIERGLFAEFGVGTGVENNTLVLASLGWSGFWVGGEALAYDTAGMTRLKFTQAFITRDTIAEHARAGAAHFGGRELDVISLDLDGNDIHFVRKLLEEGFQPRLFIVEYNGKFPPPVRFEIAYDPAHRWRGDDYFGASLASFADLFAGFGYRLACCNAQNGANAFFVREADMGLFADVPGDIATLYTPPRYHLYARWAHPVSVRTVEAVLRA